jgi:TctA family transporter
MFSSWPVWAFAAGAKIGSGRPSDSRSPAGLSHGSFGILVSRPIAAVLLGLTLVLIVAPLVLAPMRRVFRAVSIETSS